MTLRSTPRESIEEETIKVRQRQLEEAQKHILYIRYQRCGLTKETMQAMTCVTGDSAIWPGVPFTQCVHHVAFCDKLLFRVLPIVLTAVKGHRRNQERRSWTRVTLGRYVGSGREVLFDISSWILAVIFITPRQSTHGRRTRSSAMPPGEHRNGFTPTMSDHDHRISFIDDGAGAFHRTDTLCLPDLRATGTYRFWTTDGGPEIQTSMLSLSEPACKHIHLKYYALLSVSCGSAEFEMLPDRLVDYTAVFVETSEAAGKEESVLHYTLLLRLSEPHDSSSSGSSSCSLCRPGCRQFISNPSDLILKSHVRDFSYICTPSEMVAAGADARDLERNSMSSGPILQAGAY